MRFGCGWSGLSENCEMVTHVRIFRSSKAAFRKRSRPHWFGFAGRRLLWARMVQDNNRADSGTTLK